MTPTWSLLLAVLLLGPALGSGYLLTYDMVWVPDLAMRPDFWGLGSGLPRAVPSDAVVAVVDEVVPGWLLQKAVLLASLVVGGLGAARWLPPESLSGRLVAVSIYQWNPLVTERLAIGHWPVLVGYAVLPWLALAARRWRRDGGGLPLLLVLVPLGSLSVSAGLATALTLLAFGWRGRSRGDAALGGLLVAGNAPWLVTGLLHTGDATTDRAGAALFALSGSGALPAPLAALGLGGSWNAEVVLPSREGPLSWVALGLVTAAVWGGWRAWSASADRRDLVAFGLCWTFGLGAALLTWAAPDLVAWAGATLPGAGVLRDGARSLVLCAPLLAVLAGHGAAEAVRRLPGDGAPRLVAAGVLVVLPVTVLPDAAWGLGGRLRPADFPADYVAAQESVATAVADGQKGDVLLLPLASYRQPEWNHHRKVLDPLGRFLSPDFVASDELVVSGVAVAGEDPRVARVAAGLALPDAAARARALAAEGIGLVVVDETAPGSSPLPAGRTLLDAGELRVLALDGVRERRIPTGWYAAAVLAWAAYGGALAGGLVSAGLARRRRRAAPASRGTGL
ncbi:hypothetical protein [Nocardioides ferulae]|uniref:hypothetical protein n=1 Tax=Nocardioides ferulae TaxID=2340821 RepID=UPI000F86B346|nr:hypothetical protein [Nocardioides ferulae]